jgi:hypothetical protein
MRLIRRALTLIKTTVKAYLFYDLLNDGIIVYSLLPENEKEKAK